jgi:hypothetical protein
MKVRRGGIGLVDNVAQRMKDTEWIPSWSEILLYSAAFIMLVMMVRLIHYTSIRKAVKEESRCLREKANQQSGQYLVYAKNARNQPMYSVAYDMNASTWNLSCTCKEGDVANNFEQIPVYDFKNPADPIMRTNKLCKCDKDYATSTGNRYYDGNPGLIRFMTDQDVTFFTGKMP